MRPFSDLALALAVDLGPGQWADLYFAATSGSYDEYALKCAAAGVMPVLGRGDFERRLFPGSDGGTGLSGVV